MGLKNIIYIYVTLLIFVNDIKGDLGLITSCFLIDIVWRFGHSFLITSALSYPKMKNKSLMNVFHHHFWLLLDIAVKHIQKHMSEPFGNQDSSNTLKVYPVT